MNTYKLINKATGLTLATGLTASDVVKCKTKNMEIEKEFKYQWYKKLVKQTKESPRTLKN